MRFAWVSSEEVRIDAIDERSMHLLPLAFGWAAQADRPSLERALWAWLCRRTAPMGRHFIRDLMFSLGLNMRDPDFHRKALGLSLGLSLMALPEKGAADDWAPIQAYLHGKRPALFDHWMGFPSISTPKLGERVERLRGFRFRRHPHYNLPAGRLALIERFLQKRVSDISRHLEKADDYKANPLMTQAELATVLGREKRTIERKVRMLRDGGLLRRVGSDKTGSWAVEI